MEKDAAAHHSKPCGSGISDAGGAAGHADDGIRLWAVVFVGGSCCAYCGFRFCSGKCFFRAEGVSVVDGSIAEGDRF